MPDFVKGNMFYHITSPEGMDEAHDRLCGVQEDKTP